MKQIVLLPGDGIGPEVMNSGVQVLQAISAEYGHQFNYEQQAIGGAAIDEFSTPLPDATVEASKQADAILLGAVGGSKWDDNPTHLRPEQGLLGIRKALDLYANLRPIQSFSALLHASPLKEEIIKDSDILIVRELASGLYFGKPSERRENGEVAVDTVYYHRSEIERIVEYAFKSAMQRKKLLTSVDKANVLETSRLWREIVNEMSEKYPEVTVEHMLVDAAAMQLITAPNKFDVIVTENMFGDILSDEASVLTGSIGMLPSASLSTSGIGLYEPVHGSAPDIAGKGIANPLGMILTVSMMLRHSFQMNDEANAIERAVQECLAEGYHTGDLQVADGKHVSTEEMTELIVKKITDKDVSEAF